ncbi:hypothetical protein CAAN1_03S06920 [[Candida] anglica]|uniref:Uncharacterized protein n=1 Tax=[Candida] anglica TaxID=148631 RepID=A0ABP0EKW0_9ASCO
MIIQSESSSHKTPDFTRSGSFRSEVRFVNSICNLKSSK